MRLFLPIFASLTFALCPTAALADGQIKYMITSETTANVVEQDSTSLSGDVIIPSTYSADGVSYSVSTMAVGAFKGCKEITSIDLSSTEIPTITYHAFAGCTSLKKIILPTTVTEIQGDAFGGCTSLESIELPNGLVHLGEKVFTGCESLDSLTIPGSVSTLESNSLCGVNGLRYLNIEEGVQYLSPSCANGCEKLETVILPESLASISNDCFAGDIALKEITLPKAMKVIGNNAFSGCTSLANVIYLGDSASYSSLSIQKYAFYDNASGIKLQIGKSIYDTVLESSSQWRSFEGSPWNESTGNIYIIGELGTTFIVNDTEDWTTTLSKLSKNDAYSTSSIIVESPISFEPTNIDIEDDNLSHLNISNYLDSLKVINSFAGKIEGNTISNGAFITSGIFNTIEEGAKIDGLVLDNTLLYIDPCDSNFIQESNGKKTVPILARTSNGSVTNFGFHGSVIMDADLWGPDDVELCLVYDLGENAEFSGYIYIDDAFLTNSGTNKRCITIKQNLGVRNSPTRKIKMAKLKQQREQGGNKSLSTDDDELDYTDYTYTDEELNESERYFDEDEFASGVVALWLNYEGQGYTGNYTGRWRQGKTVPIAATRNADGTTNGIYPVVYANESEAASKLLQMPHYANNGSPITLSYSEANRPEQIKVGDESITPGTTSTTFTFNANKPISVLFSGNTSDIKEPKTAKVTIKVAGRTATFAGADGEIKTLYSLTGKKVAETNGDALTAPAQGLYILRCGSKMTKVIMR